MQPNNRQLMQRLRAVECRDSSYTAAEPPLVFARAAGSTIWDVEGRPYIDLCAGFGVMALGHNNAIQRSVFAASFETDHLIIHGMGDVYPSQPKIELLDFITSILPSGLNKAALALSGGQAVELAVKTAQIASQAAGFITFEGAYHGLDLGILPLTSRRDFKDPFRAWLPEQHVSELPFACDLEVVENAIVLQKNSSSGCAAIIVEPIQGRAGIRQLPKGWLKGLSDLCRQQRVLLIYDEVFTGLGRTGSLTFAESAPCDLLCLGKALGGGLPLSVCVGRSEVMDAWPLNQGEGIHTGTFFGHPLACRLGLATLQAIIADQLPERALSLGAKTQAHLREALSSHRGLRSVRGQGLMIGIEFAEAGYGVRLMDALRSAGVIVLASGPKGEGISLTPALTIPESELDEACRRLIAVLKGL